MIDINFFFKSQNNFRPALPEPLKMLPQLSPEKNQPDLDRIRYCGILFY